MYLVREIPVDAIEINDQALRYEPEDDSIIELANDIIAHGLLQPIGVRISAANQFQLLWGGRRLAAHRRLGKPNILAHIYQSTDIPVKALALVENIQRVNLTLKEECDAIAFLHYDEKKSPDQISALLSKSRSWVMRRLALPNLPEELRGPVFDGRLSIGAAEEICKLPDPGARSYIATQAIQCAWSISDVRNSVEVYLATPSIEKAVQAAYESRPTPDTQDAITRACDACGAKAEYPDLVNVWVHKNGCPNGQDSERKETQNGHRSE